MSDDPTDALTQSISAERLGKYLSACDGNIVEAIGLYEYNMRISEAFYAPLQCLEITLRNHLHRELTEKFGIRWYETPDVAIEKEARRKINFALDDLRRRPDEIKPGSVVAELSFGFWVTLLATSYDNTLWRQALYLAFRPDGRPLARNIVYGRMNALRRFRNRVAHHEPIFHKDLIAFHNEVIGAISWMCPSTARWANANSRAIEVIESQFSNRDTNRGWRMLPIPSRPWIIRG